MNDSLHKHYALLSKKERLTLYLRAVGRADQRERDAVIAATPKRTMQMGDFYPELDALQTMILLHFVMQLDNLVGVLLLVHGEDKPTAQWHAARLMAQNFLATEEAWQAFAAEYGLAYDKLLTGLAGPLLPVFTMCRSEPLVEMVARWDEGLADDSTARLVPTSAAAKLADYRQTLTALIEQAT